MIQINKGIQVFFCLLGFSLLSSCQPEPISAASACGTGGQTVSPHPRAAEYQAVLNKYVSRGLPGISASIRDEQGEWIGSAGKADLARNVPMEPCHLVKIASITKMVVATLTLMLAEESVLSLDDKLTQWLPGDVTRRLPNADQITLSHLLSHRSGLQDFDESTAYYLATINNPNRKWTQRDILEFVYDKPALFRPGTQASYANTNTVLVSMMIEAATGRSHAELLRERILNPLGMNNTYYQGHDKLPENRVAQGYIDLFNNNTISNASNFNVGSGNGHTGLLSTVADMQTFINALFGQQTLISQPSLDRMTQFLPSASPVQEIGLGIFNDLLGGPDGSGYGHGGQELGYMSHLYWLPDRKASLALLVNYGNNTNSPLNRAYWELRTELADKTAKR